MIDILRSHIAKSMLFSAFLVVLSYVFLYFFVYEMDLKPFISFRPSAQYALILSVAFGNIASLIVAHSEYNLAAINLQEQMSPGYITQYRVFLNSAARAISAWMLILVIFAMPVSRPSTGYMMEVVVGVGVLVVVMAIGSYFHVRLENDEAENT